MSQLGGRGALVGALVAVVVAATPSAALAHGVGGSSETAYGFIWLGVQHMLLGWDHLLFVGGVALLAGTWRRAAKLISVFAIGHSITLFTATVADWHVNPVLVDVAVALSLVFVGVVGLIGRPKNWTWFTAVVLAFGLVHGLGLSTRLQELGLPEDGTISRVLAFNLGVEIGQMVALLLMYIVADMLSHRIPRLRDPRWSHIALIVAGVVAAGVLTITGLTSPAPQLTAISSSCQVQKSAVTYPAGGGHPLKDFFEPTEQPPAKSFGHVLGDGFVIVHYNPGLPADQLAQLRTFVTDPASGRVVGGPDPAQTQPVKAVHAFRTELSCSGFDLPALKEFAAGWFTDPRSKPVE